MARLLIVAHSPSPALQAMFEAVAKWRRARPRVAVIGRPGRADQEARWELGALLAAQLSEAAGLSP